ncbi:hypothetical protein D0850_17015 [Bordetella avium]|uniref:BRO-N domain-containing protein n=1 Tax=Bordetella avium TaxID=521 RepID=UPI000E6A7B97|nr:Bro-N domain-containing protein [Bordetella avium]RIQ15842.1 hypothetical protein D0850_17015 [Bordetella avium]
MTHSQGALALDQHAPSVFNFGTHEIRIVMRDGEPWFVCTDVASALGYLTAKDAARHLDDDEKGRHIVPTPGGDQNVTIINESGLYALVLRSRKPEARKFAKWVTSEVLPTIRKTGSYGTPRIDPAELLLDGQSDLTIELPEHIQAALNARAGILLLDRSQHQDLSFAHHI